MAELVCEHRHNRMEMGRKKNIYVCIFINFALLCNKANYNVLRKLPDSCTQLPLSIIAII